MSGRPPFIFLVAGEPSGDALGAALMAKIKEQAPAAPRFAGVGGARMTEAGLVSLFPMADLSVMGVAEVVPRLPLLLRRIRQTADAILAMRPDAIVTIDSSSFNNRVAKRLVGAGSTIPRVHYVAPMVWAWRPGRAKRMAALYDHLLALLPFEPLLFEREGLATTWVGHPVVEQPAGGGARFRREHGIAVGAPLIAVLAGSRASEVERLLPVFADTVRRLGPRVDGLQVVLPTVEAVVETVSKAAAAWPVPTCVVLAGDAKRDAFAAADVALAVSGTVTLELAWAGVPMVVAYRLHPLSYWLGRRLLRVPHISLVNILLGRPAVPELLQGACAPDRLADAIVHLLRDPEARAAQRAGFGEAIARLAPAGRSPSAGAAERVLALAYRGGAGQSGRQPEQPGATP
ncbi:MAG: lipid-A-disaccharide synthase [Alphaproteobacteria bacterium]|nr:lipid-A-disaccharide synthase [Alphaproteobacteria bacterium]